MISKSKSKAPTYFCKISFINKAVELINALRSKISNFNKSVSNLGVKAFLLEHTILPCNCADFDFINRDHQHIVTGDFRFVGNKKRRKLFTKDPKYRETDRIPWGKGKLIMTEGLNDCCCSKYGIDKLLKPLLVEWKDKVIDKVNGKIRTLSKKTSAKFRKCSHELYLRFMSVLHRMIFAISLLSPSR